LEYGKRKRFDRRRQPRFASVCAYAHSAGGRPFGHDPVVLQFLAQLRAVRGVALCLCGQVIARGQAVTLLAKGYAAVACSGSIGGRSGREHYHHLPVKNLKPPKQPPPG